MTQYPLTNRPLRSVFFSILILLGFSLNAQLTILGGGLTATDCTADGTIVVGDNGSQHFMWDATNGITLIGGVSPQGYGGQTSINADGSIIAGTYVNPANSLGELSMYDTGTQTWTPLGSLGSSSGNSASSAWDISADGSTIVGLGWVSAGGAHAIKWTSTSGIEDLGSTVPGRSSRANKCSEDGTIIGGWQDSSSGFRQGAIWTNGVQQLITHTNGDMATEVSSLSRDGVWAGGGSGFSNNYQAWRWSQTSGLLDIGPAPTAGWRGSTSGFSEDGGVVVGFYRPFPGPATFGRGFIFTESIGMVDLTDYAIAQGIDVMGFILALPLGISDDGSTVVGLTNGGNGFVLKLSSAPITNDECSGAIALECEDVVSGSTVNATDSGGNSSPDVFYSFDSSANTADAVEIQLCDPGTNFDTVLRVFSDCTLTDEIEMNDDWCGAQSYVSFVVDGTSTYYIMVEGAGSEAGNFVLSVSCLILGTEDHLFESLSYYPNPVHDQLNISNAEPIAEVKIYSVSGQQLFNATPNATEVSINTTVLRSGIYFAEITVEGVSRTIKFIK